jgi:hypothetical protein
MSPACHANASCLSHACHSHSSCDGSLWVWPKQEPHSENPVRADAQKTAREVFLAQINCLGLFGSLLLRSLGLCRRSSFRVKVGLLRRADPAAQFWLVATFAVFPCAFSSLFHLVHAREELVSLRNANALLPFSMSLALRHASEQSERVSARRARRKLAGGRHDDAQQMRS